MTTRRSHSEPVQLDLGFPTLDVSAPLPIDRGRKAAAKGHGWHGMQIARLEVDWKLALELAPDGQAVKVHVEPRSPAHRVGLRTGDYVLSASPSAIAEMALADLDERALPPGSDIFVKFYRPQGPAREVLTTVVRLREPPSPAKEPAWRKVPKVPFGPEVERDDRKRFLSEMSTYGRLTDLGYRILGRLLHHYDGPNGIFMSYATLARDVRCKRRQTAITQIARLEHLGIVEVLKFQGVRTNGGFTNRFVIHWPDGWGANVIKLGRRK